jgi:5-oxoprolinase (ATP-hydrolysing)
VKVSKSSCLKLNLANAVSQDPAYDDAPTEGIRRILSSLLGKEIPRGEKIPTEKIETIRLSTTVATNALLERKGRKCALVVTKGFKVCLQLNNHSV